MATRHKPDYSHIAQLERELFPHLFPDRDKGRTEPGSVIEYNPRRPVLFINPAVEGPQDLPDKYNALVSRVLKLEEVLMHYVRREQEFEQIVYHKIMQDVTRAFYEERMKTQYGYRF